jgi:hypothetical protein
MSINLLKNIDGLPIVHHVEKLKYGKLESFDEIIIEKMNNNERIIETPTPPG